MINFFKKILGVGGSVDYNDLMKNGAIIIDVRTPSEFSGGHIKGSQNIPLNNISSQLGKLKKDVPIITCCASGMRSGSAKKILEGKGFTAYNGGGWYSLKSKLNR